MESNLTNILLALETRAKAKAVNPDKAPSQQRITDYPLQIWYLILSFLALVSICHFAARLLARRSVSASARGPRRLSRLPLAAAHVFRTVAFRTTASFAGYTLNLAEFFLACAYIAVIFTWALINSTDLEGNRFSPRYYADRSGLIVATQFPLLIALGMKNNIISFLTGISYDKLNILHRVVARVICVLIYVHAGGRVKDLGTAWFRAATLLSFLSIKPLRKRSYEAFLVAHFFVGLILLVGSYMHAKRDTVTHYVWPSFVIWGLDRLLRYLRIFVANGGYLHLLFLRKKNLNQSDAPLHAHVTVVSPHLLRVSVRGLPVRVRWAPGQVAFLALPAVSRTPWEAHPFTIANVDPARFSRAPGAASLNSTSEENRFGDEKDGRSKSNGGKELTFLVRVRGGFTRRLLDAATAHVKDAGDGEEGGFPALIDGPYCAPPSMAGFATVVLFAGGSGVSFTLPLLLDLIRESKTNTNPSCKKVVFVWAIRDPEESAVVSDAISIALGTSTSEIGLEVDIRIHVTSSIEDTDGDAASEETDVEKDPAGYAGKELPYGGRLLSGRPDVDAIVSGEVQAATGAVFVGVCGTQGLAKHVRRAVRAGSSGADVLRGGAPVSLHVESFGEA
ncbi:ferric reductase NAD binding domain-containing protein [Mycena filopes]|nr:ferric reductase NAD binding domain-containing protein [Mycena filopes]